MVKVAPQNRIATLREEHGLSLRALSAALAPEGSLGPSERSINRWERGLGGVPDKWKFALAEVFGVSVPHLMGWDSFENEERAA